MHKKYFLTRGTLGLALAASVFLGCQDFLGEEKAGKAPPSSDASTQQVAQVAASQEGAKDMPAQADVVTEPVASSEPVNSSPPPASGSLTPEQEVCLDLYDQLQIGGANYKQVKYQYIEMDCDAVLGDKKPAPPPWTPPTLEERCRLYRINLTETPPTNDPKYEAHMAEMAILCAPYP